MLIRSDQIDQYSTKILWRDFRVGDLVEVHADDYFDCNGEAAKKMKKHEYPFTIFGEIREITQRTMWVIGFWKWQCPDEWCNEEDPQYSAGLFGVPRRGPERIYRMGRVQGMHGLPVVWIAPMPD